MTTLADIMTTELSTVDSSATLRDVAQLMKREDIGNVLVMEGETLRGIVTDRDIREALPSKVSSLSPWEATTRLAAVSVQDVMRRSVLTTTADADARDAAHTLLHHRVGALPVIDDAGTVIGLLTVSDVLRDYARPAAAPGAPEARP